MPLRPGGAKTIDEWFESRGISTPPLFIDQCELYEGLILNWSARINLVSRRDQAHILKRHILDSITPIEHLPETGNLLDIGSGAGFPAIPIALVRPGLKITLIESQHKKILFLRDTARRLKLDNVEIIETRLEEFEPDIRFDLATMRALPRWEKYLDKVRLLLCETGKIIYYEKEGLCRLL